MTGNERRTFWGMQNSGAFQVVLRRFIDTSRTGVSRGTGASRWYKEDRFADDPWQMDNLTWLSHPDPSEEPQCRRHCRYHYDER